MNFARHLLIVVVFSVALSSLLAPSSHAGPNFSIDFQGPTALAPALGGPGVVSDGDILKPLPTPVGAPMIWTAVGAAGLGLVPTPIAGGSHGGVELDALSFGTEPFLEINDLFYSHAWEFSVDEFAVGNVGGAVGVPSSVYLEGASGLFGGPGIGEASADVFTARTPPGFTIPPPIFPFFPPTNNTQIFDGNGDTAPHLNLIEPNPPTPLPGPPASLPDPGDNLDAWDRDTPAGTFPTYYSLDSDSVIAPVPPFPVDPLEGVPVSTGSAVTNGFVGGDVVTTAVLGGTPALYAAAAMLGLDADGTAPDTDDLDALILAEDGDGVYTPAQNPYDWLAVPGTDMLLYSVRRGSAIIGMPDALTGTPITEGDILMGVFDPVDGLAVQDGVEGDFDAGIFVFAEQLGLATVRSGTGAAGYGVINPLYGADTWDDELDALDVQLFHNCPPHGSPDICNTSGAGFLNWQRGFGSVGPGLSAVDGEFTGDQVVDAKDLTLWQAAYGTSALASTTAAVPEPTSWVLIHLGVMALIVRRQ